MRGVSRATLPGEIVVRTVDSAERTLARATWIGLDQALGGAPSLACSWDWTETWLDSYGDVVPHRFLIGEADGGETVGIALITDAPVRPLRPRGRHLGTAGEPPGEGVFVERNRMLTLPDERLRFAAALSTELLASKGWDELHFDGMHPDDAAELRDALRAAGAHVTETIEQSPVSDLQAGEDVLASLSKSRRQRIRRTLRAFGDLELEWAADAEVADEILTELIDLHQQRWTESGALGAFASPRFVAFHRALIARLVPAGRAALVRVRRGDEVVGCLYGLLEGDRMCFYQGGLRRYEDNRLRAGVAAHVSFMEACRERGVRTYDFLAPATRYKEELATGADSLTWLTATRSAGNPRLWLAAAARAVRGR